MRNYKPGIEEDEDIAKWWPGLNRSTITALVTEHGDELEITKHGNINRCRLIEPDRVVVARAVAPKVQGCCNSPRLHLSSLQWNCCREGTNEVNPADPTSQGSRFQSRGT